MKEIIKTLLDLQELDSHLTVLLQERDDSPRRVAALTGRRAEQEELLTKVRAEQEELLSRRQDLEQRMEDNERKLRRSQNRVGDIKNVRQHKAMLKEIEDLKLLKQDWEDELLGVMEGLEEINPRVEKIEAALTETTADLEAEEKDLQSNLDAMEKDIQKLAKDRKGLAAALPPEVLSQYDFIRSRLSDAAVAPVIGGTCQICHMRLTPQQSIELQRMEVLMNCPNCQRIIYSADEA